MDAEELAPNENDDEKSPVKQSPKMSKLGKAGICFLACVAFSGLVTGLVASLVVLSNSWSKASNPIIDRVRLSRLSYFDESALQGYGRCQDLEDDLKEALEIIANVTIHSLAVSKFGDYSHWHIPRGGIEPGYYTSMAEDAVPTSGGSGQAPPSSGENSFATNNQVEGVDEADQVKSDGTHIFMAYGDTLVVTNAKTGMELSRTQLPTKDENGVERCEDIMGSNEDTECYSYSSYSNFAIEIASLILHQSTLAVVASTSLVLQNHHPALKNHRNTRIFIYDVSEIPSDLSPLTLMARTDLQGSYQTARSIGENSHIVTSSSLDTYYHLESHLNPWNDRYIDMKEEEYRSQAFLAAQEKIPYYAEILTSELRDLFEGDGTVNGEDRCSFISKVAIMFKQQANSSTEDRILPSFTDSSSLKTLTQVYSLDLQQGFNGATRNITTFSSGAFFPTSSYTSNVYASDAKLVVAGESYAENEEGQWVERTILLVYDLRNATSVPFAVGDVPGSLLNQFSMDHHYDSKNEQEYLRVATTTWGRWGVVDNVWQQTQTSESQVSVLQMPTAGNANAGGLQLVGSVGEIGVSERIYAARFFGERAYVVTCKCCVFLCYFVTSVCKNNLTAIPRMIQSVKPIPSTPLICQTQRSLE